MLFSAREGLTEEVLEQISEGRCEPLGQRELGGRWLEESLIARRAGELGVHGSEEVLQ